MGIAIRFLLKNRALRFPHFRRFLTQRFCLILALNMQTTIIAYWMYLITGDVVSVGKLGLFEAIPAIGCSFFTGHLVESREKRTLLLRCISAYVLLAIFYCGLAFFEGSHHLPMSWQTGLIYGGVFVGGVIRAFVSPSSFSLLGLLLPRKLYANGATWSSTSWQAGGIMGPLLAGLFIAAIGIKWSIAAVVPFELIALVLMFSIPKQAILQKLKEPVLQSVREGLKFIRRTPIIFTALLLDMFAVLLGGATALLPAYAQEVLDVGEIGYGWLRAAPGMGAILMYIGLSFSPLKNKPGGKMALAIAGYGICIIVFGISTSFVLSFAALLVSGALDSISVVVRGIILQLYTPDDMRGRVSAVNTMFVSSSNELGEVESGYTAHWFGLKNAVLIGGFATIIVVSAAWTKSKALRKLHFEG